MWVRITLASAAALACSSVSDQTSLGQEQPEHQEQAPASVVPPVERGTIVFRSDRSGEGTSDLYVMAADGSNLRRLTQGANFFVPTWAPDGRGFAFRRVQGLDGSIGLMGVDGEPPVLLVRGEDPQLWDQPLGWQGESIVYDSRQDTVNPEPWLVTRSGGQRRQFFGAAPGRRLHSSISPIDARIALVLMADVPLHTTAAGQGRDIWLLDDVEDTVPENLTRGRVYSPNAPRWSPDGNQLAFYGWAIAPDGSPEGFTTHDEGGFMPPDAELFVVDVHTGELTRLTDNTEDEDRPVWTPDGSHLLFTARRGDAEHIWTLPVAAPEQLAPLTGGDGETYLDGMADCFWGALGE